MKGNLMRAVAAALMNQQVFEMRAPLIESPYLHLDNSNAGNHPNRLSQKGRRRRAKQQRSHCGRTSSRLK